MLLFCDCATAAFWFHCCSNVHAWPWALKGTKEAQSLPEKSCVASLPPQGSIAMVRVGELGPILKPNGSTTQLISIEAPPLNLLEASSRRASRHTLALDVKDSDLPRLFTDLYVKAIREKDIQWAVKPEVVNLFSENPSMVSQDKQSFHGLEAVTGRLNKGAIHARIENVIKSSMCFMYEC